MLTVLTITRSEHYAIPFLEEMSELAHDIGARFLVAADGDQALARLDGLSYTNAVVVRSHGYIESVLDEAIGYCEDGYVLRLDDDERASDGMYQWLLEHEYEAADHWCFPRANLWPDENQRLAGATDGHPECGTLWPDLQTRLSVKAKAGRRKNIHVGSPFGSGQVAPVVIEHHKLIVRSFDDRLAQAQRYERIQDGAGLSATYGVLQVPERWPDLVKTVAYTEVVPA